MVGWGKGREDVLRCRFGSGRLGVGGLPWCELLYKEKCIWVV